MTLLPWTKYHNDWENIAFEAMLREWEVKPGAIVPHDYTAVGFASYLYEDSSGWAIVVFWHDGKLYEVNGSHCSCYGLEGQWEPEETSLAALETRRLFVSGSPAGEAWKEMLAHLRTAQA